MNYLGKISHSNAKVCEPLRKLISSKCRWTWDSMCQNLYDSAKNIMKNNVTIAFYNEKEQLFLETDVSGMGLGPSLLQVRDGVWFQSNEMTDNTVLQPIAVASKSLTSIETCYSNIDKEAIGILHSIGKCNHYCFALEVSVNIKPQATGGNLQDRCHKPITHTSKDTIMNPSVQYKNNVQA